MINKRVIIGIILFIVGGLVVFTFANPGQNEEPTPNNQEEIELANQIEAAEEAVVKAETTTLQVDVDAALVLVNALPNGTEKEELLARLSEVQKQIDLAIQTAAATAAVEVAETTKSQTDLDQARELVLELPEGDIRTGLSNRLDAIQSEINLRNQIAAATAAVVKAEETIALDDITLAKNLVNLLPEGDIKESLMLRMSAVEIAYNIKIAREGAIKNIDDYIATLDEEKYSTSNWSAIKAYRDLGVEEIMVTSGDPELSRLVDRIIANINSVKTLEIELREAKELATNNLNNYYNRINFFNYFPLDMLRIYNFKNTGIAAIASATTPEAVQEAYDLAVNSIEEIETVSEYFERLKFEAYRNIKKNDLNNYVIWTLGRNNYSSSNWTLINSIKDTGINNISSAMTYSEVDNTYNSSKAELDAVTKLTVLEKEAMEAVKDYEDAIFFKNRHKRNALEKVNRLNESELKTELLDRLK